MAGEKGEGPVTAALFDVDGTLIDTNYLQTVTWWEAFAQAGYEVPMADIHRAIGMGSGQMPGKLLPQDRDTDSDTNVRLAHSALYATYRSRLRPRSRAADLLRACKRRALGASSRRPGRPGFTAARVTCSQLSPAACWARGTGVMVATQPSWQQQTGHLGGGGRCDGRSR